MHRLLAISLLLSTGALWGQSGTTLVTAQVKDTNNTLYVNCQWSVVFVGENVQTGSGPYFPDRYVQSQQGNCDSNANFSVNLGDNINTITPIPSQWQFNVCSAHGYIPGDQYCFKVLTTITGAAQSLTSTMQQAAPALPLSNSAIVQLNNNWTGTNAFILGATFGPPANPYLGVPVDNTGICAYPNNLLVNGQGIICSPESGILWANFNLGPQQFFFVRPPFATPAAGSFPQWSVLNNDFEVQSFPTVPLASLAAQGADTMVMNASGGSAVPTAVAAPTGGTNGCSGATNSVTYNNSTHAWGCNTITPTTSFMLSAYCTGTIGASNGQTYVLTPGGGGTSCSSLASAEQPMPVACTAQKMFVNAGAAGAQAGSGAMVLFKNGSAQALTCTLGTGTTCSDTNAGHNVSFSAGDTWSVRTTTIQATDTTANIRVALVCQ